MQAGEVWWVDFDERRPVVLLSAEVADTSRFLAMQVVPPAGTEIDGVAAEVAIGAPEGLPFEGVLRVAFPRRKVARMTVRRAVTDGHDHGVRLAAVVAPGSQGASRSADVRITSPTGSPPTSRSRPAHQPHNSQTGSY